jgi:hypothetical protein
MDSSYRTLYTRLSRWLLALSLSVLSLARSALRGSFPGTKLEALFRFLCRRASGISSHDASIDLASTLWPLQAGVAVSQPNQRLGGLLRQRVVIGETLELDRCALGIAGLDKTDGSLEEGRGGAGIARVLLGESGEPLSPADRVARAQGFHRLVVGARAVRLEEVFDRQGVRLPQLDVRRDTRALRSRGDDLDRRKISGDSLLGSGSLEDL